MLDRPPVGILRGGKNFGGLLNFGKVGAHGLDDGANLVRVDAPHPQEAKFLPGTAGIFAHHVGIADFDADVVCRDDATAQGGGGNFAFGAYHQRVLELAGATHGAGGYRAVVGGDKIHQAEIKGFDKGQGGNLPGGTQCAGGFDEDVQRDAAVMAAFALHGGDDGVLRQYVVDAACLGQDDVGNAFASLADDDVEVVAPVRVGDVVDARADATKAVGLAHDAGGNHFGVFALAPGGCAVFAVAGDVEYRAPARLAGPEPCRSVFHCRRNVRSH